MSVFLAFAQFYAHLLVHWILRFYKPLQIMRVSQAWVSRIQASRAEGGTARPHASEKRGRMPRPSIRSCYAACTILGARSSFARGGLATSGRISDTTSTPAIT